MLCSFWLMRKPRKIKEVLHLVDEEMWENEKKIENFEV